MELEEAQEAAEAPDVADDYEDDAPVVRPNLTIEEAAEIHRDNVRPKPEPERPEAPKVQAPEPDDSDPGALWTTEDIQTFQTLRSETEAFQKDLADLQRVKQGVDLNELEKTDRARAAMFRSMIREAEDDLRQRQAVLGNAAQTLQGRAVEHAHKQGLKKAEAEKAKLLKARSDFDVDRTVAYMKSCGVTDEEIAGIRDHRIFVAAWDAAKAASPPKSPKFRKRPAKADGTAGELTDAEHRFRQTGREEDAARLLSLRKQYKAPPTRQTRQLSADDLHDRLKRTGRIEDAVAYKLAQKGRAA